MSDEMDGSIDGEWGDPAAAAMDSLRRIVRALRAFGVTSQRDQKVSAAQLFVLRQIRAHPGLSMSGLADRTLTSQSAVSEVTARLVQRGLVTRLASPSDHRRAELALTDAGVSLLDRSPETVQERLVAGFRSLTPTQQRALAAGLEAWLAATGLASEPASMFFEPVGDEHGDGQLAART